MTKTLEQGVAAGAWGRVPPGTGPKTRRREARPGFAPRSNAPGFLAPDSRRAATRRQFSPRIRAAQQGWHSKRPESAPPSNVTLLGDAVPGRLRPDRYWATRFRGA